MESENNYGEGFDKWFEEQSKLHPNCYWLKTFTCAECEECEMIEINSENPRTFIDCVAMCLNNKELVTQYNRLYKASLGVKATGINAMIDKACGYDEYEQFKTQIPGFMDFVYEFIWSRLPDEAFER